MGAFLSQGLVLLYLFLAIGVIAEDYFCVTLEWVADALQVF